MTWAWHYLREDGSAAFPGGDLAEAGTSFVAQADAESWIGEVWRELRAAGVNAVVLYEDERLVYGPMSLSDEK